VTEKHTWLDKQRIVPNPTDPFVHD
jgi:hypothetical protein